MSSPSCPRPKCTQPLSTYPYPDDAGGRALGFTCKKCKVEWFLKTHARGKTFDECPIKHDGKDYYERVPSLIQKPRLRKVEKIADLKRGDQLVWKGRLYEHHAIVSDIPDSGYQVIHFAKSKSTKTKIRQDNFFDISKVHQAIFSQDCKDDPNVIVARALYMYQNRKEQHYNLANFNCETLANYCSTGAFKSFQVDGFPKKEFCTSIPIVASSSYSGSCVLS